MTDSNPLHRPLVQTRSSPGFTWRHSSLSDEECHLDQSFLFQTAAKILNDPDFDPDVPERFPVQLLHRSISDSGASAKTCHHSGPNVRGYKASGYMPRVFQSKKSQFYLVQFPDGVEYEGIDLI